MATDPLPFRLIAEPASPAPDPLAFQLNLFTGEPDPVRVDVEPAPAERIVEERLDEGISVVRAPEGSHVIVNGFGCALGKKSDRLVVRRRDGKVLYQFPFLRLQEVIVGSRGLSVSSDLIAELCERGIRLSFLRDGHGEPYAMITSPMLSATVATRRCQLEAYRDDRGVAVALAMVEGKIRNQAKLLRYFGKHLKHVNPAVYAQVSGCAEGLVAQWHRCRGVRGGTIDDVRDELMGMEGAAGRQYWAGIKAIVGERLTFMGRAHRGATDAFNAMLNYGYGILYSQVWGAVLNAGLDPFAGFLHVDRPGKPSLVLDLTEEFRQPIVDRVVVAHVNLGQPIRMEQGRLDAATRDGLAGKILERLQATERYRGGQYQLRSIIQMQARRLASVLRRDTPKYQSFAFKW